MYTKNGVCIEFNPADIPRIQNRKPRTISGSTSGSDQNDEEDKKDDFTVKESEFDKMSMIIGYNASDITYGQGSSTSGEILSHFRLCIDQKYELRESWSGGMSGFTLYYSHFTDIVDQEGHNFPLSPGLIPIVYFQNVERVYLGAPFTTCISANAVNSYEPWRKRREAESRMPLIYKESHCITRNLMTKVASYCNCYLR